ncbi:DDE-type integrase/transposase/recombinase, partial [Escherichia coli]|nr:DDE-type integrase/transposase/recombinase [Escherichia coli]
PDPSTNKEQSDAQAEIRRLQKELKRVTDERDILKKAAVDSIGYRKIHLDLRDSGQQCGVNRVWRLMKRVGIKAQVGYRSPRARKGEASIVSPNRLQRQFNPDAPDERWVTDITYIRTHEGWLYLAVVVDLFSRKIIGWSMQSRMTKDIVLNALLMA